MKDIDIFIALVSCFGAFYVSLNMGYFFLSIYGKTKAYFKWLLLSIAIAKFSLGGWALTNAMFMIFANASQPIYTLPWRVMILLVICIQIWLVYKINEGKEVV